MKPNGELIPVSGGRSIPLVDQRVTIGREAYCTICIPSSSISRKHCELTYEDGFWYITDLDSKNGVRVNNVLLKRKSLAPRDRISVAKKDFIIQYELGVRRQELPDSAVTQTAAVTLRSAPAAVTLPSAPALAPALAPVAVQRPAAVADSARIDMGEMLVFESDSDHTIRH